MMFRTITTVAMLCQGLSTAPVDVSGGRAAAFPVEWSSFSAFMESLSTPLALRLVGWLVLGCGIGIGLSFLVRRRARAIVGGILGGLLASGGFLVMVQRLDEMAGHILAASVLGLTMAMMFVLARMRGGKVKVKAPVAKSQSAAAPASKAVNQSAPAPTSAPQPAPTAQSSSTSASDTEADDEDESAPAAGASAPPPEDEAAPQATPKPSAPPAPKPAPMKPAPTQAKSAPGPSWMHD